MNNYAYVTGLSQLFTTGEDQLSEYLTSVIWLDKTLKNVKSKYPLYCMVNNLSQDIMDYLEKLGIKLIHLEQHPFMSPGGINKAWDSGLIKLCTFGLTQFDKLIWLDSDIEILQNIDHLFNLNIDKQIYTTNMNYFSSENARISSGVFLVKPSIDLINFIVNIYNTQFYYADEDILYHIPNNIVYYLDPGYNVSPENDNIFKEKYNNINIKIFHYIGGNKPYNNSTTINDLIDNPDNNFTILNNLKLNCKININKYIEELELKGIKCNYISKLK